MSKQRSVRDMQRGQAKFKAQSANRANAAKAKAVSSKTKLPLKRPASVGKATVGAPIGRPKVKLPLKRPASVGKAVVGAPIGRPAARKQGSVKSMQAKQAKFKAQSASRKRATAINANNTNTAKSKKRFTMTKPVSRNR